MMFAPIFIGILHGCYQMVVPDRGKKGYIIYSLPAQKIRRQFYFITCPFRKLSYNWWFINSWLRFINPRLCFINRWLYLKLSLSLDSVLYQVAFSLLCCVGIYSGSIISYKIERGINDWWVSWESKIWECFIDLLVNLKSQKIGEKGMFIFRLRKGLTCDRLLRGELPLCLGK